MWVRGGRSRSDGGGREEGTHMCRGENRREIRKELGLRRGAEKNRECKCDQAT